MSVKEPETTYTKATLLASIALLAVVFLCVWMIKLYIDEERSRDLQRWQDRLSVIAETKKRAIENWLDGQFDNLEELAGNPLVQIYLSMDDGGDAGSEVLQGQISHLRNLVQATARRAGVFSGTASINASTDTGNGDGIAIINGQGELRMATRGFPVIDHKLSEAIMLAMQTGRSTVQGIYPDEENRPRLALIIPVTPVQAASRGNVNGAVVAIIDPRGNLFEVVAEQWLTTSSDESSLVLGDDFSTTYITPLRGDYGLFYQVPMANQANAANFARSQLADFAVKTNYMSRKVLVTSRNINRTQWVLVQKIDAEEALRESSAHREFIFTVFLLVVFILSITFIAVWRHATSMQLRKVTERLGARTELLNAVTDNINDNLLLVDNSDRLVFVNESLAIATGADISDVRGKALNHLFTTQTADRLIAVSRGEAPEEICELEIAGGKYMYHVSVATLSAGQYRNSRLILMHDITRMHEVQQQHKRLLEGIITTLVRLTDMHDPHCAHHSERTRDVAISIARAMDLDEEGIDALGMASMLANIGKLNLPRELLTKMESLTPAEESMMHDSINHTVNILQSLEFDGPVVDVIRQKNERLDGSGYPASLSGDDIRLESRILAVANAFVAMTSSRAYRPGKPVHDALDVLLRGAGKQFDRAVVAALFHVAESRGDWSEWQSVQD